MGALTGASLANALGGSWRKRAGGKSFVVSRRADPGQLHGADRVGAFADRLRDAVSGASLVSREARAPFVFFDLETTGLSGGAGTHAFLVGCGWFDEDGGFVTEQHLMVDYASERAMLRVVADDLARTATLVTFNGKSFDAPVLETRYLFHRLESPCARLPHVDLLHPARRFWASTNGEGCSLAALERRLLGARRSDDVPGVEIPARYFQFIRSGDPRPLAGVLEHNRLDLLSLAGLTARLFHLAEAGPQVVRHATEALALGRVYEREGLEDRAEEAFGRAIALSTDTLTTADARRALALAARRRRQYEAAAVEWRHLIDLRGCPGPILREAVEALAIHHEHRARDLAVARTFALRGLEMEAEEARGDAIRHRLARIERKMTNERRALLPSSPPLPLSSGSPMSEPRTSS